MKFYDEQLRKLQEQIARKGQLGTKISELRAQRSELSDRGRELETILKTWKGGCHEIRS